ncbi:MAG: hypothetical protein CW341_06285 [Bacteroidetes bacterium]|nr:hypothetical protein [Bacteroidota bacterium]
MNQDERWIKQYDDVMEFLAKNHRNPSRHRLEEHDMLNWVKHNRKLLKAGKMAPERVEMMGKLVDLWEERKKEEVRGKKFVVRSLID